MDLIHTTLSRLNYERCRSCKDIKGIVISAAVTFYLPIFLSLCNSDYPIEMQRVILQYFPLGLPFPSLFSFHQKSPSRNLTPLLPTRIFDFITEIWVCIFILICNIFCAYFTKLSHNEAMRWITQLVYRLSAVISFALVHSMSLYKDKLSIAI